MRECCAAFRFKLSLYRETRNAITHNKAAHTTRKMRPMLTVLPAMRSRCLHAGCHSVGIRTSSELFPQGGPPHGSDIA
jgi:hypothetical protein